MILRLRSESTFALPFLLSSGSILLGFFFSGSGPVLLCSFLPGPGPFLLRRVLTILSGCILLKENLTRTVMIFLLFIWCLKRGPKIAVFNCLKPSEVSHFHTELL